MKKLLPKDNNKGSLVVEAAIVLPIVIFVIFLVIYICYVLYLQTYIQTVTNEATEIGVASWSSTVEFRERFKDEVSVDSIKNEGLYWRISDPNKDAKCNVIREYIYKKIGTSNENQNTRSQEQNNKITYNGISVEVDLKNYIIYKKLVVKVEKNMNTPFDQVKKLFGLKEGISLKVESQSIINEPTESIRNIDFASDT